MNNIKYINLTIAMLFAWFNANAQSWKFDALYAMTSKGLGSSYNSTELGARFQNENRKADLNIGLAGVNVLGQPGRKNCLLSTNDVNVSNDSTEFSYYSTEVSGVGFSLGSTKETTFSGLTLLSGFFLNNILQINETYKRSLHFARENAGIPTTDQLIRKRLYYVPTVSARFGVVFKAGTHLQVIPQVTGDLSLQVAEEQTDLNMTVRPTLILAYQR